MDNKRSQCGLLFGLLAIVVSSRLVSIDSNLEEAALGLAATPSQAFIKVLLPLLAPAILAICRISFVLSIDGCLISTCTAGIGSTTFPMEFISRN